MGPYELRFVQSVDWTDTSGRKDNKPVESEAQKRFMYAVAEGDVKKKGLSPTKAKEFIGSTPKDKKLPKKKKKKY